MLKDFDTIWHYDSDTFWYYMILPDTAWCYIILNDIKWWYMTLLLFGKTVSALLHSSRTAPVEWRAVVSGTGEHRQGSEFALRDVSLSVGSLILQGLGSKHVEVVWHYLFLRKQSKNLNKDPSYSMLLFRESRWMVFCFHQSLRWTFKRIDCKSWGRRCAGVKLHEASCFDWECELMSDSL